MSLLYNTLILITFVNGYITLDQQSHVNSQKEPLNRSVKGRSLAVVGLTGLTAQFGVMSNRQSNQSQERNSNSQQTSNGPKLQTVKLVLLGDQGVGKSSIALRFVRGEFHEHGEATIGAAFLTQTINVSGPGQSVKFDIWDTAGQERYHSLAPMYYRGAQAAIVVYDITNAKSFNSAITWVSELRQQANSQIVVVLAGNKADIAAEKRVVAREDGENLALENNLVFIETSAKTGMHVPEIFMSIAQSTGRQGSTVRDNKGIKLGAKDKKKGKCC